MSEAIVLPFPYDDFKPLKDAGLCDDLRVLLVEDSADYAQLVMAHLATASSRSFKVDRAVRLDAALARAHESVYDAILLDLSLPDADSLDTLGRATELCRNTPTIVVTGEASSRLALAAGRAGIHDYLVKTSFDPHDFPSAIQAAIDKYSLEQQVRRLAHRQVSESGRASLWDAETGLASELAFCDRLSQMIAQARRKPRQLAVIRLSLDHVDALAGIMHGGLRDEVVLGAAERLRGLIRGGDTVARVDAGGFGLLLDWVPDRTAAAKAVSTFMAGVSQMQIRHASGIEVLGITSSVGVALYPADGSDFETLLENADSAMASASRSGGGGLRFYSNSD